MRTITVLMLAALTVFVTFLGLTVKALPYTDKVSVVTTVVGCEILTGGRSERSYHCLFDGEDYAKEINVTELQYKYYNNNKDKVYSVKVSHPRFIWFIVSVILTVLFGICFVMLVYARHTEEVESPYHE